MVSQLHLNVSWSPLVIAVGCLNYELEHKMWESGYLRQLCGIAKIPLCRLVALESKLVKEYVCGKERSSNLTCVHILF